MLPLVYIIGVNAGHMNDISQSLTDSAEVKRVTRAGLMTAVYHEKPTCILVIESDLDGDALSSIDATLALDYIPLICISYRRDMMDVQRIIGDATNIDGRDAERLLPSMVTQASSFMKRYEELSICNETFEVMNEAIRDSLEIFVDTRINYSGMGMLQYLDLVYRNNISLDMWPGRLWLLRDMGRGNYNGVLYNLKGIQIVKEIDWYDEDFSFEPFEETGFIKNCESRELSDITSVRDLMPGEVHKESGEIENVACYANRDVMCIAMDYNGKVGQSDLNILKALTVNVDMMVNIKSKVNELEASFIYTMNALARAAEGKDDVTGHHIKRVNMYSGLIARHLKMEKDFIEQIEVAAQMHDVGKILIPDEILNKPGKLTDQEYEIIKSHTTYGVKVIGESDHLSMAAKIAECHHEKYDGTGYPNGLKGKAIPLEARIVALADIYDALRSPRPYKEGFTHAESYDIIVNGDGRVEPTHFDPDVLQVFLKEHEVFDHIYTSLEDAL